MKKKAPLARTVRWSSRVPFLETLPVARFYLRAPHLDSRDVRGKLGETLLEIAAEGKATFLDKPPRDIAQHLMVVGYPGGVVVHYFTGWGFSWSYTLRMCTAFRDKLVGGNGKVRWAKVKAA